MADFRGYVTAAGQTFEALAKQMGYPVTIGFIEVGDGKLPDSESPIARTQLVHKLKQFPAIVEQDAKNPDQWVATCYIPADDAINGAGYFIREIGCKLINQGNGVLYAYRRVSDDWKPVIDSGEAKSFIYKLRFIPSNGELLTPTIDPSVVLVDREELDRLLKLQMEETNLLVDSNKFSPPCISAALSRDYRPGDVVTTSSYYSKEELKSFGVESPGGGGARYIVINGEGISEDRVKYHKLKNGMMLELLSPADSRKAGMIGNFKKAINSPFDNYERLKSLDKINRESGGTNRIHAGDFYISKNDIILTCDTRGDGNYSTNIYVKPQQDESEEHCIFFSEKLTIRDISFYPSETDSKKEFMKNPFSAVFSRGFEYSSKLCGPTISSECAIIDCAGRGFSRGARGVSGSRNITIVRGDYWGGDWGVSFYNIRVISFDGTKVYGGNMGGLALPSCKHISISGNTIVYNPDGTGINTGGSSAIGFNVEDVNIASCTVYARDCINLENGCASANVTGYKIHVLSEQKTNGVAIGVMSRSADNGGVVTNINIGPGKIEGVGHGSYSYAVRIGFIGASPNGQPVRDIKVSGVSAIGCRVGCETISPSNAYISGFNAGQNSFDSSFCGYVLGGEHVDGSISGGNCTYSGDVTISNTYGVRFDVLRRFSIEGLKVQGFHVHYNQKAGVQESQIINPVSMKGRDLGVFVELLNESGAGPIPIKKIS